ncbi:MAG: glycosyltransferase family 2 protein [Candidatus Chisholmbacteria bacterium]|nr:glycosyltransferase family 2 protein [Candidatus Chisholmbacteria bacterium]
MKRLVIIPAFNEAPMIRRTLKNLKEVTQKLMPCDILVVDDGSGDKTGTIARNAGVLVLRHKLNRGLGGALGTGLEFAKRQNYDVAVTFDADGQHHPNDIVKATEPIERGEADIVIGTRTKSSHGNMPVDRRLIIRGSNVITWLLFGVWTSDSQSGFRAFSKKAIQHVELKTDRMEVASEIFAEAKKHKLKVTEVPITVIYTDYSRSKGQGNLNAINIFYKLLLRLAR